MKKIFKKFLIVLLTFLLAISISIISKADDEDTEIIDEEEYYYDEEENYDYEDDDEDEEEYISYDYQKNLFEATSEDITISEIVDGDSFVFSAGTVTIDTVISGNLFICASNIIITENAQIYSSLFSASESLTISGIVYGNVYTASESLILEDFAFISKDLFATCQNITINGSIYRDAYISSSTINISEDAFISGDLKYSSENEITVPEGVVGGETSFDLITNEDDNSSVFMDWLYSAVSRILLAIVIFAICKWLHCKFINNSQNLGKNLPRIILYGILALILTPIAFLILLMLGVTIPVAVVLLLIYIIIAFIASSVFIITLANLCAEKTKEKFKTNDNLRAICFIIIFGIIYQLLLEISIIGTILMFVATIMGLGILIKYLIPEKTKIQKTE